ncbi:MAG: peptidylprolyl isomerase [Candidatus Omnitrophica bacterium]|nr:peptidylprolyl isomerase [Candidatus Omnitrophota bacterium]
MSKYVKTFICCIAIALPYAAFLCYAGEEVVDRIVAVVNDEIITQSELEESTVIFIKDYQVRYGEEEAQGRLDEAKSDALNRLIEEKLILQEAKKRNISVEEADVEARFDRVRQRFPSEEEFKKSLSESGLTIEKLKNRYKEQLMMQELVSGIVSNNIRITPTQTAAYYYGHKDEFMQPEQVKFRIMLLRFKPGQDKEVVKLFAEQLLYKIKNGEDFASLAKQYSEGPNAQEGGDMGAVSKGNMAKEIDAAIFSLNDNEVSGVIETSLGCNIIKVEQRIPPSETSLQDATPVIRERIFERESELVLREFLENLKKEAYIQIKL